MIRRTEPRRRADRASPGPRPTRTPGTWSASSAADGRKHPGVSAMVIKVWDVSDVSRPQPAVDDLAQLMPVVVPLDEADAELVVIGERYWALAGFAPELGTPVWCEKVKDIDTADWGQQIYVVAAAGVRAMVTGRLCPQCAGPLSLTSRAAFQQVCDGDDPACADCNESLTAAVRVVVDPARRAKREAARAKAEERSAIDSAHAAWKQLQRDVIAEEYVAAFPSNGEVPASGVREMVGALALLRYAPSTSPSMRWPPGRTRSIRTATRSARSWER